MGALASVTTWANCRTTAELATSFAVVAVENGKPATKRKLAATRNEILERLATLAAGIDESRRPRTFFMAARKALTGASLKVGMM